MAWPSEHKTNSRKQILDSAARLFTAHGYAHVSITDVMNDAGMTHGAFYAHFKSKKQLYSEAIHSAAIASMTSHLACQSAETPDIRQVIASYLSMGHARLQKPSCPLAFLTTDVAARDQAIRDVYTNTYQGFIDLLTTTDADADRDHIYALSALMIGGVAIARALTDDELAQKLLDACNRFSERLVDEVSKS